MDTVKTYYSEKVFLTRAIYEDDTDEESQRVASQPPTENLLHSLVQDRPRLTPLENQSPLFISGLYGYGLGLGLAALGQQERRDGWTIGVGVIWSSIAGVCSYFRFRDAPRNEGQIDRSYIVKHASIIGLCAASACIANWQNFC